MMILSKRHTGNDRQGIQQGEVHTLQDFAEKGLHLDLTMRSKLSTLVALALFH